MKIISKKNIQEILEAAINAPSGSNSQPWRFKIHEDILVIIAQPEKDHPVLNFRNRGTWMAHGALIENISIAALKFGYEVSIKLFPESPEKNITAHISFSESSLREEKLFKSLSERTTNRKPFSIDSLTLVQKQEFLKLWNKSSTSRVVFIEAKDDLIKIGKALSVNEQVILDNKELHQFFFNEIIWSKEEELIKKSGLYIKTMELKTPERKALKVLRYWWVMRLFNNFGLASKIASNNAKTYSSAAGVGVIKTKNNDHAFLEVGRLIEEIWLTATNMGLSFHLITGVPFFHQRIKEEKENVLSRKQQKMIEDAYNEITAISGFQIQEDEIIAACFRIGKCSAPSSFSTKKRPLIEEE